MCECPTVSFQVLGELFCFVHFVVNCLLNKFLGFKRKRKKEKEKEKEIKGCPRSPSWSEQTQVFFSQISWFFFFEKIRIFLGGICFQNVKIGLILKIFLKKISIF
jgi:hypothetical protein